MINKAGFKRISANYLMFKPFRYAIAFSICFFLTLTRINRASFILFSLFFIVKIKRNHYFIEETLLEIKLFKWLRIGKHHNDETNYSVVLDYRITHDKIILRGLLDGLSKQETNHMLEDTNKRLFQTLLHRRLEGFKVADNYSYVEFEFYKKPDENIKVSRNLKLNDSNLIPITLRRNWNLDDSPHAIISGGTGSGKSYLLMYLLLQFELMNGEVLVIDPKMSDLMQFKNYYAGNMIGSSSDEIIRRLRDINKELEKRQLQKLNGNNDNKPFFIVFDEFPAFLSSLQRKEKKEVESILSQIILKGRSLRVFLVIAMQRADASTLSAQLRDQFGLRIALSRTSQTGLTMIFDDNAKELVEMTESQKGYLKSNDMTIPIKFQTPTFDIDINKAFDYVFHEKKDS